MKVLLELLVKVVMEARRAARKSINENVETGSVDETDVEEGVEIGVLVKTEKGRRVIRRTDIEEKQTKESKEDEYVALT